MHTLQTYNYSTKGPAMDDQITQKKSEKSNTPKPNVQNLTDCASYRTFRNKCVNSIKKVRSEY